MFVTMLGSIGIGIVWGCLIGGLGQTAQWGLRNVLALSVATLLLAAETYLFADWSGLIPFLGAAGVALLLNLGWRRALRQRFTTSV